MVFNGDWNGGERRFSIRAGQRLTFERLVEKDGDGNSLRELGRGDLDGIDEFRLFEGHVLRWRNRMPGDPPFRDELRIYELDYVISGVLLREGGQYVLDHDFAFPDRSGIIEHLHGELTFDPSWQPLNQAPTSFDIDGLQPGQENQHLPAHAPHAHQDQTRQGPVWIGEPLPAGEAEQA